ncbi:MAG: universal stress protein [Ferruginibacter sp.]|nr:universal stress protein [Cytophagales bacterium]
MKTILVPTDFSQPANNALAYATGLAVKLPARLLLLHVFWIPGYESDTPNEVAAEEDDLRADAVSHLLTTVANIHAKHPELAVESLVMNGFVGD